MRTLSDIWEDRANPIVKKYEQAKTGFSLISVKPNELEIMKHICDAFKLTWNIYDDGRLVIADTESIKCRCTTCEWSGETKIYHKEYTNLNNMLLNWLPAMKLYPIKDYDFATDIAYVQEHITAPYELCIFENYSNHHNYYGNTTFATKIYAASTPNELIDIWRNCLDLYEGQVYSIWDNQYFEKDICKHIIGGIYTETDLQLLQKWFHSEYYKSQGLKIQ